MELNLTANGKPQELILAYLQANVSETLAEKINNGVRIQKDGKTLINKKDLTTFMEYATEQAKKQLAENQRKGAQAVCVHGDDIMSWAIHYFEEDSIEGKLYNEDGTEYKPPAPVKKTPTTPAVTPPKPAPKPQMSIFDMMTETTAENSDNSSILPPQSQKAPENADKPIVPVICANERKERPSLLYQNYLKLIERHEGFLILYRLGDFYEAFGDHATTLSSELNLTLTGRDVGLDERVPMTGIPYHAIDNYVNKLIDHGYKVVLAEDLDNVLEFKPFDDYENTEELSEKEMREFDSYVDDEDEELPTVSKIVGSTDNEDDTCIEILDAESAKAFDKEAMCIIFKLLGNEITLA